MNYKFLSNNAKIHFVITTSLINGIYWTLSKKERKHQSITYIRESN